MLRQYVADFDHYFMGKKYDFPWDVITNLQGLLKAILSNLSSDYYLKNDVAIHKDANVEEGVVLKGPIIVSAGAFIGAHAYLRGGVFLSHDASIGPGCEVKSSVLLPKSTLAHFNFVGDSIVGSRVNMEAGSIVANHHNDREDKTIFVVHQNKLIRTDVTKFGALIGDDCKIGANAVLSPGTLLSKSTIVNRLELIRQQ
jgi:UDP-N-acetylglucosamine diphosphorylase / glucose-1-phosphate thymidylyltransferase / UDP-N-acetylgalactosamine diphosphorylase / glucosamine-1-phosphate N-acetyltransferase / galactosamine-1-phosphate N-acetyltransferase